jgi:hypothetical protein
MPQGFFTVYRIIISAATDPTASAGTIEFEVCGVWE